MACRAVWLAMVLLGSAGCGDLFGKESPYFFREPCNINPEDCCPPGSHEVREPEMPNNIFCIADETACADAGPDSSVCEDAGNDAH